MQVSWVTRLASFRVEDNIIAEAVVKANPASHGLFPQGTLSHEALFLRTVAAPPSRNIQGKKPTEDCPAKTTSCSAGVTRNKPTHSYQDKYY